jgi:uncharacterized membrane protein
MPEEKPKSDSNDIEQNKAIAAIGYIWILCFVPLFMKRDSKFCQFHGKQALVLFIVEVIISVFFWWIWWFGWILGIVTVILSVMGLLQALQGNWWEMPLIGQFAKKLNF